MIKILITQADRYHIVIINMAKIYSIQCTICDILYVKNQYMKHIQYVVSIKANGLFYY
jgi:hypothetical protein